MFKDAERGFTLVELSIVLVIIGLLIGGILVAQSMIGTAKVTASVKLLQQFDIAVSNFQTQYNSLPGDSALFQGNGDGLIADSYCLSFPDNAYCNNGFYGEIGSFWHDLSTSGLKTSSGGDYQNAFGGGTIKGFGPTQNVPNLPIGKNTVVVAFAQQYNGSPKYPKNLYQLGIENMQIGTFAGNVGSLMPAEALAIDSKIDDGKPWGGFVTSAMIGGVGELGAGAWGSANTCAGGTVYPDSSAHYDVTNNASICSLAIEIGGIAGTN